ncbi:methyltransferase [Streptomyces sp. NPDC001941]|uniref:methyltransferase n=1 Tax=Streptomyces sp. NPDC001941 TaxID=3154659 RepID=UPI0033294F48
MPEPVATASPAHAPDRAAAAYLIDQSLGFVYPAALRAAASAGVADHLADGPRTVAELARRTGSDPRNLHRVLRLLATRGVFAEDADGRFRLTSAAHALRSGAPGSAREAVLMLTDRTFWQPAGDMERCLTGDGSAFEALFGTPFFEHFAQDPDTSAVFHRGMAAMSDAENDAIAAACALPPKGTVVDIGGGHGGFLAAVLRQHPSMDGLLYDAAHVLAGQRLGEDGALAGRWSTAEGDFFSAVPTGDVLVLKRILHDWDDGRCVTLLRNCRRALAPGGRVLVVDAVVPAGNEPHQSKDLDLLMMTSLTGRERTAADFVTLFTSAGLRLLRVIPTGTVLSVVEARVD